MTSCFTGVRGVVMGVVVMASIVTACFPRLKQHLNFIQDDKVRKFPCPDDDEISPCTCTYNITIDLRCSNLTSEEELASAFQASFPINRVNSFVLEYSNISVLSDDVFGDLAFGSVRLDSNNLTTVGSDVFKNSYNFMEEFYMYEEDSDVMYDWPLGNIESFIKMKTIDVSGPYDTVSVLTSKTLTSATLSLYYLTSLAEDMFSGAPNLVNIGLTNTPLKTIPGNIFLALKYLENVEISDANIETLAESSFAFDAENLTYVGLSGNNIKTISVGAFSGIYEEVQVNLSNNLLTTVDKDVYYPVIEELTDGFFDLSDNPLSCGCDLFWLASLPEEERNRTRGVVSSCNIGTNIDLDTLIDFLKYQCSVTTVTPLED
ncbi:oplophorus-luciferin 2-monooxygenase non-catalytic subunit [Procambarus clarkii]|uniref:oplophorus-luciferin 2-monooxygenase non-catalytic subunit n=1 Tax=Procambarus clarkii TaxID=6728 RepID=UPI0037436FF9